MLLLPIDRIDRVYGLSVILLKLVLILILNRINLEVLFRRVVNHVVSQQLRVARRNDSLRVFHIALLQLQVKLTTPEACDPRYRWSGSCSNARTPFIE